jgi:DEAD/DEAH box helicase domain-containing protein
VGLWWQAPRHFEETLRRAGEHFLGALHASEHAAISLFPLLALCDRGDIGGISYPFHPQVGCGAVFIYDGHPGGVGITARGHEDLAGLLERVLELVAGCPCETGCPSCIQSPKCGNGNRPLDKPGAMRILRLLLGREEAAAPPMPSFPVMSRAPLADPKPVPIPPIPPIPEILPTPAAPDPVDAPDLVETWSWRRARLPEPLAPGPGEDAPPRTGSAGSRRLLPEQVRRHRELPRTVLFDVETLRSAADVGGFGNCHRMGVAIAVACFLEEGSFAAYGERQVHELAAALRQATLVVGFNVKRFDFGVLAGYTGEDYCRTLPTLDLLEDVHLRLGFRVAMGRLALDTLGLGKSADGLQSLEWVKQGRLDLVEEYCRRDVEILRDLYLHGRREGCLFYHDQRRDVRLRLAVDW